MRGSMVVLGSMSTRRFSEVTRLQLQLAFARALEALTDTYQQQAAEFVRRLRPRLSVDEALERYFREVGVPEGIEQTVRSRALISLTGLIESTPRPERQTSSWGILRPDQMVGAIRRRVEYVEATNLDCKLAASMSDEAIAETHVRSALVVAEVLSDEVTPDEAIMHYVRSFNLVAVDGQVIFRKAMAQWAELHPLPGEAQAITRSALVTPSQPRLEPRVRSEFGLRVMV
jgi:hypothetical protein